MPEQKATIRSLQAQLDALTSQLAAHGIAGPPAAVLDDTERADYIAHGSIEHEAYIGLVRSKGEKDEEGRIVFESLTTKIRYMLEDEITPYLHTANPREIAFLTLRQKVNSIESGAVRVPDYAPPMHVPAG